MDRHENTQTPKNRKCSNAIRTRKKHKLGYVNTYTSVTAHIHVMQTDVRDEKQHPAPCKREPTPTSRSDNVCDDDDESSPSPAKRTRLDTDETESQTARPTQSDSQCPSVDAGEKADVSEHTPNTSGTDVATDAAEDTKENTALNIDTKQQEQQRVRYLGVLAHGAI